MSVDANAQLMIPLLTFVALNPLRAFIQYLPIPTNKQFGIALATLLILLLFHHISNLEVLRGWNWLVKLLKLPPTVETNLLKTSFLAALFVLFPFLREWLDPVVDDLKLASFLSWDKFNPLTTAKRVKTTFS